MKDHLCFVQFLHPGGEHEPETEDHKSWNTEAHKRKFMRQPGRYVNNVSLIEADIVFWGEWEPESTVLKRILSPATGCPHFIYSPYYVIPTTDDYRQNTDPFIFGDCFLYVCCQQHRRDGRPTQLRYLKEGSVLLFGSCLGGQFVLDTVFVVAGYEDYLPESALRTPASVPLAYEEVTLKRIWPHLSYRLYRGASYANPYHEMYNFFPCRPDAACPGGFARPRIINPQIITNTHKQGRRLNNQQSLDEVRRLWEDVRDQVTRQNLDIGVYAQVPDGRYADPASIAAMIRHNSDTLSSTSGCARPSVSVKRRSC